MATSEPSGSLGRSETACSTPLLRGDAPNLRDGEHMTCFAANPPVGKGERWVLERHVGGRKISPFVGALVTAT